MPRRTKDAAIGLLVLVNIALLCTALTWLVHLPQANAQTPGQLPAGGQYLVVAGQVQTGVDAQYVLDVGQQRLYVFSPGRSTSNVIMNLTDMRDLKVDFAKQPTPTIPPRTR